MSLPDPNEYAVSSVSGLLGRGAVPWLQLECAGARPLRDLHLALSVKLPSGDAGSAVVALSQLFEDRNERGRHKTRLVPCLCTLPLLAMPLPLSLPRLCLHLLLLIIRIEAATSHPVNISQQ